MRLPRFTTRRLMVLVALAALALGIYASIEGRRARFRRIAQYHLTRMIANSTVRVNGNYTSYKRPGSPRERGLYFYHRDLWMKYDEASPWLPVPPDQPMPE